MSRTASRTRSILLGASLACLAAGATPATAITIDDFSVTFQVTGGGATVLPITVPITLGSDGIARIESFFMMTPGEWEITLTDIVLDPDPSITYASSVIDFGTPSSFGFIFSQAIVPTPAPGLVSHTHSSSTTSGGGSSDTVPVTALAPPAGIMVDSDGTPEIAVYNVSTDGGGSFLSADMDLSPSFVGAGPSDEQGPFSEGPIPGPAGSGSYDFMRVDVNFSMAGGADAYTFNGQAVVVPEPASAALLALALSGLAAWRRMRR